MLLKELSHYIAHLHSKGVLHLDMSPGNILYLKEAEKYHFTLIDINRMQFLPSVSTIKRYKSFKRLAENERVLTIIARLYAEASNLDVKETVREINRYSNQFFSSGKRARTRNNTES